MLRSKFYGRPSRQSGQGADDANGDFFRDHGNFHASQSPMENFSWSSNAIAGVDLRGIYALTAL